jgi:predicted nucleic acid-binding protein
MSATDPGREFVDSNVLVYAYDRTAGEKGEQARALVADLWKERRGCLSLQVLQEFFVSVTRKVSPRLSFAEAAVRIRHYCEWILHEPSREDLLAAIELQDSLKITLWDAMVVQSARRLGCRILWSEDLNHGQTYAGVTVHNPFLHMVMEGEPYGEQR